MAHFFLIFILDALGLSGVDSGNSSTVICDIVTLPRITTGSYPIKTATNWSHALLISPQIEIGNNNAVSNTYYMIQPLVIMDNIDSTYTMKYIEIARMSNIAQIRDVNYLTIRVLNKEITCENGSGFFSAGNIVCISW